MKEIFLNILPITLPLNSVISNIGLCLMSFMTLFTVSNMVFTIGEYKTKHESQPLLLRLVSYKIIGLFGYVFFLLYVVIFEFENKLQINYDYFVLFLNVLFIIFECIMSNKELIMIQNEDCKIEIRNCIKKLFERNIVRVIFSYFISVIITFLNIGFIFNSENHKFLFIVLTLSCLCYIIINAIIFTKTFLHDTNKR